MRKRKNIFKPLVGVNAKNKEVKPMLHSKNERWIFGVLPADREAPNIEDEKPEKRFIFFFLMVALIFAALFGRSFYLQVVQGSENLRLAQENRFRTQIIRAPRGIFYDRNKIPLVKNVPNYEVVIIPSELPRNQEERERAVNRLSETIGMSVEDISQIIQSKDPHYTQPVLIKRSVSRENSLLFESRRSELKGFQVITNPIRKYLDESLLAHTLGYIGRISPEELKKYEGYGITDYIGKTGLERAHEKALRGIDGKERIEVDSAGEVVRVYGEESPIPGESVVLTIDFELQKKLAQELKEQMERAKVKKGSAVAMNPQNGEILALVSLPTFDNNLFSGGISEKDFSRLANDENAPLLNRVIDGEYPSGSTIKPFLAAAALDKGTITERTTIMSTGGIEVGEWRFPDWKRGGHGLTDVFKAIAESVNTFFYAIGGGWGNITGLGPELIKSYLEKFGFGSAVRSELGAGADGHLPSPDWKKEYKGEQWFLGDTFNMSIGQGDVLVTPLQMVNALSAIVNGGRLFEPHFIKATLSQNGNERSEKPKNITKENFINSSALEAAMKGMRQTITAGSARMLADLPVGAAGKTGTAEFGPNNSKKHSWFIVYAPYEKPTIAMVILLEGAGDGSEFAAPASEDVLRWYFSR